MVANGFLINSWEARTTLWIDSPTLFEIASNSTVLAFKDDNWSLDSAKWESNTVVHLQLRKYPGDHAPSHFDVVVDCIAGTTRMDAVNIVTLGQTERALETLYQKGRKK